MFSFACFENILYRKPESSHRTKIIWKCFRLKRVRMKDFRTLFFFCCFHCEMIKAEICKLYLTFIVLDEMKWRWIWINFHWLTSSDYLIVILNLRGNQMCTGFGVLLPFCYCHHCFWHFAIQFSVRNEN